MNVISQHRPTSTMPGIAPEIAPAIELSTVTLDPATGLRREAPRPESLRNAAYGDQFDWDTLFYDAYRVGEHVVLQGPPLLNLLAPLRGSAPLRGALRPILPRARHVSRNKRGEIWWRSDAASFELTGAISNYTITVQPNLSDLFAGRRVLHTLSQNNAARWIKDWIAFYAAEHGADAVLLYDNASTAYAVPDLERELQAAFPAMVIRVVSWPFRYGPQGGAAGAVGGIEAPWDSDYCQTGSLQHARFRFLLSARSVLNVDIDELVLSDRGRSIFAATEQSPHGFIRFPGRWISAASPHRPDPATCRHADFTLADAEQAAGCPPKWCIVPTLRHAHRHSWSVHNLFGAKYNEGLDAEFAFRHMKAISNSWKEDRSLERADASGRFTEDALLARAFARAGLMPSHKEP